MPDKYDTVIGEGGVNLSGGQRQRLAIHCGHCIDVCAQGSLSLKAGEFTLMAPAKECADDTEQTVENSLRIRDGISPLR